ncbi:MAG: hypothetical protein GXO39_00120 [Thermotogae bacterium]|nr:hypothetical protein [Thermotogota bacterium]
MKAPKLTTLSWSFWIGAILSVLAAFYLTMVGEKLYSTGLFILGYAIFPTLAILFSETRTEP